MVSRAAARGSAAGGTDDVPVGRALAIVGIYVALAVGAAALVFARRDVTA